MTHIFYTAGRAGDSITIDMLSPLDSSYMNVEMVWLVKPENEQLLEGSTFETSIDGKQWVSF
jgi:hypothetical protein